MSSIVDTELAVFCTGISLAYARRRGWRRRERKLWRRRENKILKEEIESVKKKTRILLSKR